MLASNIFSVLLEEPGGLQFSLELTADEIQFASNGNGYSTLFRFENFNIHSINYSFVDENYKKSIIWIDKKRRNLPYDPQTKFPAKFTDPFSNKVVVVDLSPPAYKQAMEGT